MPEYTPQAINQLLRRLSSADMRYAAALASRMGLSLSEVSTLEHLSSAGDLTASQLAERLYMTSGAITGLADRLERLGYVERVPHPRDRRSLLLRATPRAGEAFRERIIPLTIEAAAHTSALSAEERRVIGSFLEEVVRMIERHAEPRSEE